jgi:hypothetical protein
VRKLLQDPRKAPVEADLAVLGQKGDQLLHHRLELRRQQLVRLCKGGQAGDTRGTSTTPQLLFRGC